MSGVVMIKAKNREIGDPVIMAFIPLANVVDDDRSLRITAYTASESVCEQDLREILKRNFGATCGMYCRDTLR